MDGSLVTRNIDTTFADDILCGAAAIAEFLFGSKSLRRKVYHLANSSRLPTFKLGARICARRTVLQEYIKDQEDRGRRGKA